MVWQGRREGGINKGKWGCKERRGGKGAGCSLVFWIFFFFNVIMRSSRIRQVIGLPASELQVSLSIF